MTSSISGKETNATLGSIAVKTIEDEEPEKPEVTDFESRLTKDQKLQRQQKPVSAISLHAIMDGPAELDNDSQSEEYKSSNVVQPNRPKLRAPLLTNLLN